MGSRHRKTWKAIKAGDANNALLLYKSRLTSLYPGSWYSDGPPDLRKSQARRFLIDYTVWSPELVLTSPGYFTSKSYYNRLNSIVKNKSKASVKNKDRNAFLKKMKKYADALKQIEQVGGV